MSRPVSQKTIDAVNWYLSHPGAVMAGVAQSYGIHRVTLSAALKAHRSRCPCCGQVVPVGKK